MSSLFARSINLARPAAATSVPLVVMLSFVKVEKSAPLAPVADTVTVAVADSVSVPMPTLVLSAQDSLQLETSLTRAEVRPTLERYFARFNSDPVLVRRVARAVMREAERQKVAPSLIAAVLITENTTLKPTATSSVGALGLMQVMPMHAGQLGCPSANLADVDSNICHGTRILALNLGRTKTSSAALLRYNGCVRGANTPDCHRYPGKVLARAGRLRQEILAAAELGATGTVTLAEK
ncbi:MAG: transglycosylase SLT domain-containing protein [Gemmatimonadales bacterium]